MDKQDNVAKKQDEPTIEESEPVIESAREKKEKLTSLRYKIEPQLEFFPKSDTVSKDEVLAIRKLINDYKVSEALTKIEALKLTEKDEKLKMKIMYWVAKGYYNIGDYKTGLDLANKKVEDLLEKYKDLSKEFTSLQETEKEQIISTLKDEKEEQIKEINTIEVEGYISYIFLKYRLLQARINKAIGQNGVAHDICNSIMLYVKLFKDEKPQKFWLSAVKAAQVQSTQLCNAKEYEAALVLLKNIGMRVTQSVGDHFLPAEKFDDSKVLQDNMYSFNYRRVQAQYHIYFQDYTSAADQLKQLLQDELEYYGIFIKKAEVEASSEELIQQILTADEVEVIDILKKLLKEDFSVSDEVSALIRSLSFEDKQKFKTSVKKSFQKISFQRDPVFFEKWTEEQSEKDQDGHLKHLVTLLKLGEKLDKESIEKVKQGSTGKPFKPVDLDTIDIKCLQDKDLKESEEFMYSKKSHPFFKVLQTLMLLAETFSCKCKTEEALKIYDYIGRQYMKLFVTNNTVLNSYLIQQKSECLMRSFTERNKEPANEAEELASDSVEMMEMIIGKKQEAPEINNFLLSIRIQQLGDVYRDTEKPELAEKAYLRCQTMIGNMFGEDHPAIIPYNGNLVTCYSQCKDEELFKSKKESVKQIIEKNFKIANDTFGQESIHFLYHLSGHLINKLALGDIMTPTQANPLIQKMRKIITKFNNGDPRKLANQMLFQIQLLYGQMLSSSMGTDPAGGVEVLSVVSEIYTYVISAQVKYCKMNMKHPFLEQTFMNIAIFNRSMKKFADSLQMWKLLEGLQKDMYGEDSYNMMFTWKNIGTCYLGIGNSDQARDYFQQCIDLIKKQDKDSFSDEIKKRDKDEIRELTQNLYHTFVSDRNFEKALECADHVIAGILEEDGQSSRKLSSKYYQKASSLLNMRRREEAIETIEKAIESFDANRDQPYSEEDQKRLAPQKQLDFNRIQYQNFLCSCLFIQGRDFDRIVSESEKGIELCNKFEYEILKGEATKLLVEFESIKIKAQAKKQKTSALDLKEELERSQDVDSKVLAHKTNMSMGTAAGVFLITSGATMAAFMAYQKLNK